MRRLVGYEHYDMPKQVQHLNRLYEQYRPYVNYFLPVTRLVRKERTGVTSP